MSPLAQSQVTRTGQRHSNAKSENWRLKTGFSSHPQRNNSLLHHVTLPGHFRRWSFQVSLFHFRQVQQWSDYVLLWVKRCQLGRLSSFQCVALLRAFNGIENKFRESVIRHLSKPDGTVCAHTHVHTHAFSLGQRAHPRYHLKQHRPPHLTEERHDRHRAGVQTTRLLTPQLLGISSGRESGMVTHSQRPKRGEKQKEGWENVFWQANPKIHMEMQTILNRQNNFWKESWELTLPDFKSRFRAVWGLGWELLGMRIF